MPPETADARKRVTDRVRQRWQALSGWRAGLHGADEGVSFGRCPIRIAINDPALPVEGVSTRALTECRAEMKQLGERWPLEIPRLAVAGDTGLGKTTLALGLCVRHAGGSLGLGGVLLYVVHDRQRVRDMLARLRDLGAPEHLPVDRFADLLGRQPIYAKEGEDWATLRFGCKDPIRAGRAGRRGRRVQMEVCRGCDHASDCRRDGFLAHTKAAGRARVVVTTVAKLADVPEALWKKISAVICDEDVLSGLQREFYVTHSELDRASRWIRGKARRRPAAAGVAALRALLPLIEAVRDVLASAAEPRHRLLAMSLPEDCDRYATEEGRADLRAALPRRYVRSKGGKTDWRYDPKAPAPWERGRTDRMPRQTWGKFLSALTSDLSTGTAERNATIEVVRSKRHGRRRRLHVRRFDIRAIQKLRERPLLLLDATLHPAVAPVLNVEVRELRYDQGRTILQALCPLGRLSDLCSTAAGRDRLTPAGHHVLAQIAAFFGGRTGYVLCRPGIAALLRLEAKQYHELRRATVVTVKRERGWDAGPDACVFVVLGRYAKNGDACVREARALRALMIELTGSAAQLDSIAPPSPNLPFRGRGKPATYLGEIVERVGHRLDDPLAAALQEADRVATVRQFVGRDRSGRAEVLLLRGDPTIGADGLCDGRDLPAAIPAQRRRLVGGRSVV